MYVIETTHRGKKPTVTKPLEFDQAKDLFASITGLNASELEEGDEAKDGRITLREATLPELCYSEDGLLMVDNVIAGYSPERILVAHERAEKEVDDAESEEFIDALEEQLKRLVAKDLMDYFEKEGVIEVSGVNKEGEIEIQVTDKGHRLMDD